MRDKALANECLSKQGKAHAEMYIALKAKQIGNCSSVLRNHSIVRKRQLQVNGHEERAIIEQGRFRKLEREYEGILSYSNSAKDLSVV